MKAEQDKGLKDLMNRHFLLYVDNSPESHLAAKYLEQEGINFQNSYFSGESDRNYILAQLAGKTKLPILVDTAVGFPRSMTGIKNLLRWVILKRAGAEEPYHSVPKDLAFYVSWDFGSSPTKKSNVVTCFNEENDKVYVGDINKAPHPVKAVLDTHDFKSWHEVASWEVGNLAEISKTKDKKGRTVSLEKKLVLFPDDIENLKSGDVAVTQDSRCMYQVLYEAFFQDSDRLYRVYANMFD